MPQHWTPTSAFAWCRLQTKHYENFHKGTLAFPRRFRPALTAIYAFARYSDDLVDETEPGPAAVEAFQRWQRAVDALEHHRDEHPILCALDTVIREHDLPLTHFTDLLRAFEQDLRVTRYETLADLLQYCRYSAMPVGRIVLRLFGVRDEALQPLSDAVCTGLQLVNFLQDVVPDAARGRIYLPQEWVRPAGIEAAILAGEYSPAWLPPHEQLALEAAAQLTAGRRLIPLVPRELRLGLRLFIGGGEAALARVRRYGFNPAVRLHLNRLEKTVVALRAIIS